MAHPFADTSGDGMDSRTAPALPEPLTPADCDCRGLRSIPMDVARIRDSDLVALSTEEAFKAASLPDDEAPRLSRLA